MRKQVIFLFLMAMGAGVPLACENGADRDRLLQKRHFPIVNGANAFQGEFPFMVSLKMKDIKMKGDRVIEESYSHWCGATLVSPRHIVTAAHCVAAIKNAPTGRGPKKYLSYPCGDASTAYDTCVFNYPYEGAAFIGEYSQKQEEPDGEIRTFTAEDIVLHPDFNERNGVNDIALITLETPSRKRPIALSMEEDSGFAAGKNVFQVIGWGRLREGGRRNSTTPLLPDLLQKAPVPYVPYKRCFEHYRQIKPAFVVTPDKICAGDYLTADEQADTTDGGPIGGTGDASDLAGRCDACGTDSGGPLLLTTADEPSGLYQIGIVSWGYGCAINPGVYTRISAYREWQPLASLFPSS
jgi:secreted trypsin-like serine protease